MGRGRALSSVVPGKETQLGEIHGSTQVQNSHLRNRFHKSHSSRGAAPHFWGISGLIEKGIRKNLKRSREALPMDLQKPCSLFFLIPAFSPWENGTTPDPAHPRLRSLPGRRCQPSLGSAASPVWAVLPHSRHSGLPLEWEQERGSAPAWAHGNSCARYSQGAPKALKRESFGFRVSAPVWDTEPNSLNKEKKKKNQGKEAGAPQSVVVSPLQSPGPVWKRE